MQPPLKPMVLIFIGNIENSLHFAVFKAAEDGCEIFYTGAMGDFDAQFSASVRRVKASFPHIKLICVKPYFSNDVNTNKELYHLEQNRQYFD